MTVAEESHSIPSLARECVKEFGMRHSPLNWHLNHWIVPCLLQVGAHFAVQMFQAVVTRLKKTSKSLSTFKGCFYISEISQVLVDTLWINPLYTWAKRGIFMQHIYSSCRKIRKWAQRRKISLTLWSTSFRVYIHLFPILFSENGINVIIYF